MYSIAIVDDVRDELEIIYTKVKTIFEENGITPRITCFNNPCLLDTDTYYDILFLDIDMPVLNGIDLAENYLERYSDTFIIFITNKYDLVFNAFSVHPFDFIKKENLETGLIQPIRHLIIKLGKINHVISVQAKNSIVNINCKDIIYCESYGHDCLIHTTKGTIETNKYKLSNIESIINSKDFCRINQSYLVHWKYALRIEDKKVIFEDGNTLQISKRKLKQSLVSYQKYTMRNI